MLKTEDWYFGQTNSNAIFLDNSVPADCHEKVVNLRTRENVSNNSFIATSATKAILQSVWQVRHESTGRPVADQVTITPEVD